jgi:hypothetical protein
MVREFGKDGVKIDNYAVDLFLKLGSSKWKYTDLVIWVGR